MQNDWLRLTTPGDLDVMVNFALVRFMQALDDGSTKLVFADNHYLVVKEAIDRINVFRGGGR